MAFVIVPRVLREKLGEDGADALVTLFNEANGQTKGDVLTFVEEKFERRLSEEAGKLNTRLSEEAGKLNTRLSEEVGKLNTRLSEEIARLEVKISQEVAKLDGKISEVKADLIRWMFIFWVGQIGALLGILFAFFRK